MPTYNIPGVFTSVIDRSYVQPLVVEGRSVLIAGFSKYGEDKFYNFADAETMKFTLGDIDVKRYGLGLMYGLDSLVKTRNLIFKRLMPSDATYANLLFKTDGTTETWAELNGSPITDPEVIKSFIDADQGISELPLVPKELEVKSFDGQSSVFFEYEADNVVVYLDGIELQNSEYTAVNGQEVVFTTPLIADKIINVYTILDNIPAADPQIEWVEIEYIETSLTQDTISGIEYDPANIWMTLNGLELFQNDYIASSGTDIVFQLGGVVGNGLQQSDVVRIHSALDDTGYGNDFFIKEVVIAEDNTTSIGQAQLGEQYNSAFTLLTVEGTILGASDYRADDNNNIYFSTALSQGQTVRLHTVKPGDFSHYFGALIALASGQGYNDLYVRFQPAPDVEKFYSDEEGDPRYKFNFLRAAVFEQTASGQRKVSEDFVVSLIDTDPVSNMPIISNVTGESLYINDKFKESNSFLEFHLNESFLSVFKDDLNIDALTVDGLGIPGANRMILIDQGANNRSKNIELVVNVYGEIEKKSTIIEGKPVIYTYYNDPFTGGRIVVSIRIIDGKILISEEGTTGSPIYPLYIDGIQSYFTAYIKSNPTVGDPILTDPLFDSNSPFIFDKVPYETIRQDLYNQLIGSTVQNSLWQMQSGYSGDNLIVDGRINVGYLPGDHLYHEDAKQLLIQFYSQDETIHEVLYPELDFDYVPDWTQDIDVMNAIVQFADDIGFTMPIISLPRETDYNDDYLARIEDVYLSSYNTALYSGQNNDNHYIAESGLRITCPTSYYALINHLNTDEQISITEPMANIVKGQLPVAGAKLSYIAKSPHIEKLRGVQVNTIIKEIDGIYFIDQLTAYKSASKLSRINVVKVIHRMRKDLPKILKDLLQRKALENVLLSAKTRTEQYMARWLVTDSNTTDGIFSEVNVTPVFVEEELKLIVSVAVRPIGTIEKIEVPITVY